MTSPRRAAVEVPGLAARRVAADILDAVLRRHRPLDEQFDGDAQPGLAALPALPALPGFLFLFNVATLGE